MKYIRTKTKCSVFLGLTVHFLLLILISSTASATSIQNSSIIEPAGYNNSSLMGPDGYQNSSIIGPDAYQNSSVKGPYAYITSYDTDTVAVVDTRTNNVTNIVDTETFTNKEIWEIGDLPHGVAVTPNGAEVYVTNAGSGTVSVIDTATNNLTAVVDVEGYPRGVAVNPIGTKVYVASDRRDHNSQLVTHGIISVIDTSTKNVTATIKVGVSPYGVVVSPDGTEVYVTNRNSGTVSIVDTITNKFKATIPVGDGYTYSYSYSDDGPTGVAVSPDGKELYVTRDEYSNSGVFVIDTVTQTVTAKVKVGDTPYGVAVNPAGTKVYVVNTNSGTVSVIDTATNTVTATVNVGHSPYGVSVTPDGTKVYVTNYRDNNVSVLDTTTNTVIATVNAGSRPYSFGQFIGPAPAQQALPITNFSSNVTEGYVPFSIQFTDLSENATVWSWDFENDGIIDSTDRNPVYEYVVPGNYTVNLTAANENGTDSTFAMITALEKPVAHWEYSLQEPVSGDILNINGSAFPGKKVDVLATFEENVPVSKGKFEYIIKDLKIPEGFDNFFTVEAGGARNLNVRVKMLIWVTKSSETSGSDAVVSQSSVPPGTYTIKIDGNAEKGISEVNLKISAFQGVKVDSNGNFNYSYSTTSIPPGNFKVKVGDITKEIKIKSERTKKPEPVLPVSNFSSNVTQGFVPLPVQFTDLSKNATGWDWNFGDGITSTEQNPAHTYPVAGNYTINLTAINQNGTSSKLATVLVFPEPVLPVADFSLNTTPNSGSFEVQFTDLSKNATGWNWDFGDGNISKEQNPVHTYYKNLYEEICYATLTVTNENGTDSTFRGVSVGVPELVC